MSNFTFDEDIFSDLFKETHGFRPRGHAFYSPGTSDAAKQVIWDELLVSHEAECERYEAEQKLCIAEWEAKLTELVEMGAKDRKQAIQWLAEGEGEDLSQYGAGYMCFTWNIPYSYEKEVREALELTF